MWSKIARVFHKYFTASDIPPSWSNACKSVLLIQPSSAAAECCFSILSYSFTNRQKHCSKDYIETSFMLQIIIETKIFILLHVLVSFDYKLLSF